MRSFLFFIAFLMAGALAKAQHNHFIYLQADNKQPFYVKLRGNVYSSSTSGYLIIPKLQAGTHELNVGFPKNQWPSQTIPVTIAGKDLGYLLKNFESKGWGLFNIQTMDVILSASASSSGNPANTETKSDEFSNALADVVNTPSIKEIKKEAAQEEKKPAPARTEEPVAVSPVVAVAETPKTPPTEVAPSFLPKSPTEIKKIRSLQTAEASSLTYLISDEYGSDTVDIVIPIENIAVSPSFTEPKPDGVVAQSVQKDKANKKEKEQPKFIDIEMPKSAPVEEATADASKEQPVIAGEMRMINSDCKSLATDDDFLKVRKKMTAQKSDDDMVTAAKKLFRQKCYSTAQVKNLSVLFLKDEGKYKFFDAVYPFVYDSGEFKQLVSQLSDEYYISRFRSMIRN